MTLQNREILSSVESTAQRPESVAFPFATVLFIGLCIGLFFLGNLEGDFENSKWFQAGILYGPWIRDQHQWYRVVSTVFTHGNILHLVMNMLALWTLGSVLERKIGLFRFLLLSAVSAMGAAACVLAFSFDAHTVGASGMILGYLGALIPLSPPGARHALKMWVLQIAVISLLPNVSWQGHLGGFVFGMGMGLALRGGPERFSWAAPLITSTSAACLLLAGKGMSL